jgi:hypothetical protein
MIAVELAMAGRSAGGIRQILLQLVRLDTAGRAFSRSRTADFEPP